MYKSNYISRMERQSTIMNDISRLERPAKNKHSSLLDPFVSQEENNVFRIRPLNAQDVYCIKSKFQLSLMYGLVITNVGQAPSLIQKHNTRLERPAKNKRSSLVSVAKVGGQKNEIGRSQKYPNTSGPNVTKFFTSVIY